jgi:rRNA maturation endonuclease Nob1
MTRTEEKKFKKDIKPVKHILDVMRTDDYYSKENTAEQWKLLIDLHYKWVKKYKGSKECLGCKKVFKVCGDLNRLRND